MTITEPATLLTDYLMAGLAVWFSRDLGRRAGTDGDARWWSRAFTWLAVGSLTGGSFHGFQAGLPVWAGDILWRATLAASSLSSFAMFQGVRGQWLGGGHGGPWSHVATAKLLVALAAGIALPEFRVVVADFGLTMLFALFAGLAFRDRDPRAFAGLAAGIALFAAGAWIQQARLGLHPSFNHNDCFHVVQLLANGCFFLSARR